MSRRVKEESGLSNVTAVITVPDRRADRGKIAVVMRFVRRRWLLISVMVAALSAAHLVKGCEQDPDPSTAGKSVPPIALATVVTLKPDVLAHGGIRAAPVVKDEFRLHLDFPATVQPNENELAEVTTLVRGRVVEVYAAGREQRGALGVAAQYGPRPGSSGLFEGRGPIARGNIGL